MDRAVFCLAKEPAQAERIVGELQSAGFSGSDISVLFADQTGTRDFAHEQHTKAPEGAAAGALTGGFVGGLAGWLVGLGSVAIPGFGAFIAAGPILAALSGVAAGGALGGITGALIGLGIPEYEAKRYEGKLREGNALISVHTEEADDREQVKEIFKRCGAEDIGTVGEAEVDPQQARGRIR